MVGSIQVNFDQVDIAYYLENLLRHDMLHDLSSQTCGTERVNGAGKSLLNNLPTDLKNDFIAGSIAGERVGGGLLNKKQKYIQKGGGREIKYIQGGPGNFDMRGIQDIIQERLREYNSKLNEETVASNNDTYKELLNNSILDFLTKSMVNPTGSRSSTALPTLFETLKEGNEIPSQMFIDSISMEPIIFNKFFIDIYGIRKIIDNTPQLNKLIKDRITNEYYNLIQTFRDLMGKNTMLTSMLSLWFEKGHGIAPLRKIIDNNIENSIIHLVYSSCFDGLAKVDSQKIIFNIKNILISLLNSCKEVFVEANPKIDNNKLEEAISGFNRMDISSLSIPTRLTPLLNGVMSQFCQNILSRKRLLPLLNDFFSDHPSIKINNVEFEPEYNQFFPERGIWYKFIMGVGNPDDTPMIENDIKFDVDGFTEKFHSLRISPVGNLSEFIEYSNTLINSVSLGKFNTPEQINLSSEDIFFLLLDHLNNKWSSVTLSDSDLLALNLYDYLNPTLFALEDARLNSILKNYFRDIRKLTLPKSGSASSFTQDSIQGWVSTMIFGGPSAGFTAAAQGKPPDAHPLYDLFINRNQILEKSGIIPGDFFENVSLSGGFDTFTIKPNSNLLSYIFSDDFSAKLTILCNTKHFGIHEPYIKQVFDLARAVIKQYGLDKQLPYVPPNISLVDSETEDIFQNDVLILLGFIKGRNAILNNSIFKMNDFLQIITKSDHDVTIVNLPFYVTNFITENKTFYESIYNLLASQSIFELNASETGMARTGASARPSAGGENDPFIKKDNTNLIFASKMLFKQICTVIEERPLPLSKICEIFPTFYFYIGNDEVTLDSLVSRAGSRGNGFTITSSDGKFVITVIETYDSDIWQINVSNSPGDGMEYFLISSDSRNIHDKMTQLFLDCFLYVKGYESTVADIFLKESGYETLVEEDEGDVGTDASSGRGGPSVSSSASKARAQVDPGVLRNIMGLVADLNLHDFTEENARELLSTHDIEGATERLLELAGSAGEPGGAPKPARVQQRQPPPPSSARGRGAPVIVRQQHRVIGTAVRELRGLLEPLGLEPTEQEIAHTLEAVGNDVSQAFNIITGMGGGGKLNLQHGGGPKPIKAPGQKMIGDYETIFSNIKSISKIINSGKRVSHAGWCDLLRKMLFGLGLNITNAEYLEEDPKGLRSQYKLFNKILKETNIQPTSFPGKVIPFAPKKKTAPYDAIPAYLTILEEQSIYYYPTLDPIFFYLMFSDLNSESFLKRSSTSLGEVWNFEDQNKSCFDIVKKISIAGLFVSYLIKPDVVQLFEILNGEILTKMTTINSLPVKGVKIDKSSIFIDFVKNLIEIANKGTSPFETVTELNKLFKTVTNKNILKSSFKLEFLYQNIALEGSNILFILQNTVRIAFHLLENLVILISEIFTTIPKPGQDAELEANINNFITVVVKLAHTYNQCYEILSGLNKKGVSLKGPSKITMALVLVSSLESTGHFFKDVKILPTARNQSIPELASEIGEGLFETIDGVNANSLIGYNNKKGKTNGFTQQITSSLALLAFEREFVKRAQILREGDDYTLTASKKGGVYKLTPNVRGFSELDEKSRKALGYYLTTINKTVSDLDRRSESVINLELTWNDNGLSNAYLSNDDNKVQIVDSNFWKIMTAVNNRTLPISTNPDNITDEKRLTGGSEIQTFFNTLMTSFNTVNAGGQGYCVNNAMNTKQSFMMDGTNEAGVTMTFCPSTSLADAAQGACGISSQKAANGNRGLEFGRQCWNITNGGSSDGQMNLHVEITPYILKGGKMMEVGKNTKGPNMLIPSHMGIKVFSRMGGNVAINIGNLESLTKTDIAKGAEDDNPETEEHGIVCEIGNKKKEDRLQAEPCLKDLCTKVLELFSTNKKTNWKDWVELLRTNDNICRQINNYSIVKTLGDLNQECTASIQNGGYIRSSNSIGKISDADGPSYLGGKIVPWTKCTDSYNKDLNGNFLWQALRLSGQTDQPSGSRVVWMISRALTNINPLAFGGYIGQSHSKGSKTRTVKMLLAFRSPLMTEFIGTRGSAPLQGGARKTRKNKRKYSRNNKKQKKSSHKKSRKKRPSHKKKTMRRCK